ncbi:MAG: hypothetical protein JJU13_17150 [Balneolaceae bacterium]|nr:hypothetical protein [Balneolaceae bacterium]
MGSLCGKSREALHKIAIKPTVPPTHNSPKYRYLRLAGTPLRYVLCQVVNSKLLNTITTVQ